MFKVLKKIKNKVFFNKYSAEIDFWINEIKEYQDWYNGKKVLWGCSPPNDGEKVKKYDLKNNAILTWFNMHQKPKYLQALDLSPDCFSGLRLLDVGAGPMPSATVFEGADLFALDPLYGRYLLAGYPLHFYGNTRFINAYSENIPVESQYFDAVISVNAIDHLDDLEKTVREIRRVLKSDGKIAMHVHYHKPTVTEPIQINDEIIISLFNWCPKLKKIKEAKSTMGHILDKSNEKYVLWKNF